MKENNTCLLCVLLKYFFAFIIGLIVGMYL